MGLQSKSFSVEEFVAVPPAIRQVSPQAACYPKRGSSFITVSNQRCVNTLNLSCGSFPATRGRHRPAAHLRDHQHRLLWFLLHNPRTRLLIKASSLWRTRNYGLRDL